MATIKVKKSSIIEQYKSIQLENFRISTYYLHDARIKRE